MTTFTISFEDSDNNEIYSKTFNDLTEVLMTNFKISFEDSDNNEVYAVTKTFDDLTEATKYAELVLATTSDDCTSFTIYELQSLSK